MRQISILGCGWLGFPLAKELLKKDFSVYGSTTSSTKLSDLKVAGIIPFQILLNENSIEGNMTSFLENSEVLLINIPPKLRGNATENFVLKILIVHYKARDVPQCLNFWKIYFFI